MWRINLFWFSLLTLVMILHTNMGQDVETSKTNREKDLADENEQQAKMGVFLTKFIDLLHSMEGTLSHDNSGQQSSEVDSLNKWREKDLTNDTVREMAVADMQKKFEGLLDKIDAKLIEAEEHPERFTTAGPFVTTPV